jgi:hypothetical protein
MHLIDSLPVVVLATLTALATPRNPGAQQRIAGGASIATDEGQNC